MTVFDPGLLRFQPGQDPAEGGAPPPRPSVQTVDGLRIERNRAVAMRDGVKLYVDVFRPEPTDEPVPVLVAWGPYGKHNGGAVYQQFADESGRRGGGVEPDWLSAYTTFEGPDPQRWCRLGYAVINVDPRGMWWSEGEFATVWNEREAQDAADLIGWAADEAWSNGRVGMTGVSYLAVSQWWAASLRPRGLAAINPCEGLTDVYREFSFHGGIPSDFPRFWQTHRLQYSASKVEALADMMVDRPFDDDYWESKRPRLEDIEVPAFVIASWSDQGLHTRGTLEGFARIGSAHKFLEIHGRKKWEYYHRPATVARTRQFFDRFLKDVDNGVEDWPAVRYEVRSRFYRGVQRTSEAWPLPATTTQSLSLDAATGVLSDETPATSGAVAIELPDGQAAFDHTFGEQTDIVGGMRLRLWVSVPDGGDIDLFAGVHKLDADGELVPFAYANVLERGPVALGWQRVSHRAVDESRSTPTRPWHPHTDALPVEPGEVVPVDVEIWPSGTRFEAGTTLRLVIRGSDLFPNAALWRHTDVRTAGTYTVHTGPRTPATLTFAVAAAGAEEEWPDDDG